MAEKSHLVVKKPDAKKDNSVSKSRKPGYSQSMNSPTDRILFLQRTIGNQAVQRLIKSGALQTNFRISQPGDKYEQEADWIADTVLQMPKPKAVDQLDSEHSIQRFFLESGKEGLRRQLIEDKGREELVQPQLKADREHIQLQAEEEEEEELLQAKAISDHNTKITSDIESHIQGQSERGQPLPESVRSFFEPRFGYDFRHVRLHMDKRSADVARAVNAQAFTISQNVVFGAGEFAPETNAGRWLLAHELAHTIQQRHDLVPSRVHNLTPSQLSIQRVCGSRAIGRPSGCTLVGGVNVFDISSSSDELYLFNRNCNDFKPGHESRLGRLAARFCPNDVIEIHGFASEEGPAEFNEHLSCARALKAESVLTGAGIFLPSISIFMHGATPGPHIEHRSVVIPLPTSTPTPGPSIGCTSPRNPDLSGRAFNPTTGGENAVAISNPIDALRANSAADDASAAAAASGLAGPHLGPQDASRHCTWNCFMSQRIGADEAEKFATGHENSGPSSIPFDNQMDLHNNATGRRLGTRGANCETECLNAVTSGQLRTIRGPHTRPQATPPVPTTCIGASDQPWP